MARHQRDETSDSSNPGARRRLRFLFMVMLCFISWAGITLWNQTGVVRAKMDQLSALSQQLADVKKANSSDKQQLNRINDPEYIEQMARKDFQMHKANETLIITPKPNE